MEAGNYRKTELEIITVNDLDGEPPEEPKERNLLREKTFNRELNLLVNKIFDNEKMGEEPSVLYEDFDSTEKNLLLIKCEKIIYRLKHIEDLNTISSCYNPFETEIDVYDDIDDTADYIKAGLLQSGYSKYQILSYNFHDKAFRSDINLLDQSYSTDMYFSINDPLMSRIREHSDGFILNHDLISSDPFFSKKFLNHDKDDSAYHDFYIVKISSLFNDETSNETFRKKISKFEQFLSPLLLIELNRKDKVKQDEIFRSLKETAALPLMLYFFKKRLKLNFNNYSYEETLLMIELFLKSALNSKLKSYIITLKDYSTKDNIFILMFFLSKARRILNKNSLILRISINKAVLITSAEVDDIYNTIDRINSEAGIITMQPVDYNEYLISKEFVNLFL